MSPRLLIFWKLPKHLVGSFKAAMMDHRQGDICQLPSTNICKLLNINICHLLNINICQLPTTNICKLPSTNNFQLATTNICQLPTTNICQLPNTNICQLPLPSNVGREGSTSPAAHRSVLPRPSRLIIIATIVIIPASKARTKMTGNIALAQWNI